MSKEQEQADKLIEQYKPYVEGVLPYSIERRAIKCALIDNQNTIDALEKTHLSDILSEDLDNYCAVRTILKSKLK